MDICIFCSVFYCMSKGLLFFRIILRNLEIIWKCSYYELLLMNFYLWRFYFVINRKYIWLWWFIFVVKIKRLMKIINKRYWGFVCSEKYLIWGCFYELCENFFFVMFVYSILLLFFVYKLMVRINKFCECNW